MDGLLKVPIDHFSLYRLAVQTTHGVPCVAKQKNITDVVNSTVWKYEVGVI